MNSEKLPRGPSEVKDYLGAACGNKPGTGGRKEITAYSGCALGGGYFRPGDIQTSDRYLDYILAHC